MKDVLIVVDMQNDFIDGALGTKEAVKIVPKVVEKVRSFQGTVFFTRDTHHKNYLETQEGRRLPVPHCIEDSEGWKICPVLEALRTEPAINKSAFGSWELAKRLRAMNEKEGIASVTLAGLCTDICVIANAMLIKAALPEITVRVDGACCAGVTPESHQTALEAMKMCQIDIV